MQLDKLMALFSSPGFDVTASSIFVGADRHKAEREAKVEAGSHYTLGKIKRDHESFVNTLAKHFTGRKHKWLKVITKKSFTHHFIHTNPQAPEIKIRRLHHADEPSYLVRIRVKHPDGGEKGFIYNRAMRTKRPSRTLDKMLGEARAVQSHGKQIRNRSK